MFVLGDKAILRLLSSHLHTGVARHPGSDAVELLVNGFDLKLFASMVMVVDRGFGLQSSF